MVLTTCWESLDEAGQSTAAEVSAEKGQFEVGADSLVEDNTVVGEMKERELEVMKGIFVAGTLDKDSSEELIVDKMDFLLLTILQSKLGFVGRPWEV